MMKYILAMDIGGTNPRLAMLKINKDNDYTILTKKNVDKTQSSIIPEINKFLKECGKEGWTTNVCCASVAGPVANNACPTPTNTRFPVIGQEIIEGTYLKHVLVIIDFKAIGEAIATINPSNNSEVKQISGFTGEDFSKPNYLAKPDPNGNRGVIGPGTGLGIAYLTYTPHGYFVSPSEGGHAGFPTRGDYSLLYNFIRNKLNIEHVGMEALVSGQGILHIIDFFINTRY
jgi:glucokinase